MNICHLFCYPGSGGAEKYALYLAGAAQKSGHQVSFVLGTEGPLVDKLKIEKFPTRNILMKSWHSISSIREIKKYFNENNIDIVHTHFLREHFLSVFAKMIGANIKVVRTFHRLDQLPFKVRPFYKIIQARTDAFLAVSEYLKSKMIRRGIAKDKIIVIYNGSPKIITKKTGKAIGFLGRVAPEKGIYELARKYSSSAELIIAGDGPDMGKIRSLNNRKIKLLGSIKDPRKLFERVSVLVLPSKSEVLPLSIIEAYSAGIPVVTFDIEPLREFVPKKFRISIGDYHAMVDLAERFTKGQKNNELIRIYQTNFTINKMWQKTEALYKSILG